MASYVSGNSTIVTNNEHREEALRVLKGINDRRKGRKFMLIPIGNKTYKEVEVIHESKRRKRA